MVRSSSVRMFRRRLAGIIGAIGLVGCAACQRPTADAPAAGVVSGKTVVASIRAEPRSFNRYTTRDLTGVVIGYLTHSSLVRINRQTDRLEPELAEAWDLLPDRLTYRLKLRHGVQFSDSHPFSSADVVFSFAAIYDPDAGGSPGRYPAGARQAADRQGRVRQCHHRTFPVTVFTGTTDPRRRSHLSPTSSRASVEGWHICVRLGTVDTAVRACRPRALRVAALRAGAAPRLRPQSSLLAPRCGWPRVTGG